MYQDVVNKLNTHVSASVLIDTHEMTQSFKWRYSIMFHKDLFQGSTYGPHLGFLRIEMCKGLLQWIF